LAHLVEGDLVISELGERFVDADVDERKALFAEQLRARIGLVGHVLQVLAERADHHAPYSRFSSELEDHLAPAAAEETLRTAITWGRYAELFSYDDRAQMLGLEDVTA
ncbi:MAG: AAA-associated domain-containing protein, partial [Trueperaceae bacterium]|nr:AAA-associated domain-containing protein [Trueperaceae bacterium]